MFHKELIQIHNTAQSRSIILHGNVYDLFIDKQSLSPLIPFLVNKTETDGIIHLVYELNGPIRIKSEDKEKLRQAWLKWRIGDYNDVYLRELPSVVRGQKSTVDTEKDKFEKYWSDSIGNPTVALEFLRQLTICSRIALKENLFIIIEAADMLLPAGNGDVASLNDAQLQRVIIVNDWLGDPVFNNGHDTVVFIAESKSLIHPRIAKLPQVLSVEVHSPSNEIRKQFLKTTELKVDKDKLAELTAGLSLIALQQLTKTPNIDDEKIIAKVEEYIKSQVGEDVIEFKKPSHTLDDCVGFANLKKFLREEMIPRMQTKKKGMLPGAAVAGAIGSGKSFIFEAMAGELNMPIIVLKNIRSQWFGQTDVIFERLKRVLEALDRVLIFVDEADTQFGGISSNTHETEKRLTGKIQAMMSDPKLKGKVYWLLMTARIHKLSPDIRRPGRVGDLIIPVLDPEGRDRKEFLKWALEDISCGGFPGETTIYETDNFINKLLTHLPENYSAASFASLKNNLAYKEKFKAMDDLVNEIKDFIQPAIKQTRRYQTLQALMNCTRRSLLPENTTDKERSSWEYELKELEAQGIQ
ncbi:MAG: AAA family ATPase [Crenarchaeota archaeon]|nr:MAG: AAA family ATPase [Thermoproteota archaeon]